MDADEEGFVIVWFGEDLTNPYIPQSLAPSPCDGEGESSIKLTEF
jgi:hypothetical protein